MLAVICGIARPLIHLRIMDFSSKGNISEVIRASIRGKLVIKELRRNDRAHVFSSHTGKGSKVYTCTEWPRLALPKLLSVSTGLVRKLVTTREVGLKVWEPLHSNMLCSSKTYSIDSSVPASWGHIGLGIPSSSSLLLDHEPFHRWCQSQSDKDSSQ